MEKKHKQIGQYIFENHNNEGSPDDFLEETAPYIGFIVHSFNSLDEQLNSVICEFLDHRSDELGSIVIYKMSFIAKVDLFQRLIKSKENSYGKECPSFKLLIENLKKSATLRNTVIHAEWENMDDDGYTYVKMVCNKNGMQQQYMQFTPDSLEEIDTLIHNTYMDFDKYIKENKHILSTSNS